MRLSLLSAALLTSLVATADADPLAFTFPDPGDAMYLDEGGFSFRFTLPPGTSQIECSISQGGKVQWTDKISGASSACGPGRTELKKLKPGAAKVTMRVQTKAGWSAPVALQVNLVASKPAEPAKECNGPKCHPRETDVKAEDTAKTGAEVGHPAAADLILGADRGGTWNGEYIARAGVVQGFILCPGAVTTRYDHHMPTVTIKGDTLELDVYVEQSDLTDYPERHATWTAKIAKDGTIRGTGTLSAGQLAYLKSRYPDSTQYKFAKHTTFAITGKIATLDTIEHEPQGTVDLRSHILQGRRLNVTVSDAAGLTIASGKDAPDECELSARSPDFFQLDYTHSFPMRTIYWDEPVHWEK